MRHLPIIVLLAAASPTSLVADELELVGSGKLQGTIKAITPEGVITANLEVSEEPVDIHANKVARVNFGKSTRKFDHDTMLTLINGDRLPCDVSAISETDLTVTTDYAGTLTIPRKVITTAQLGIRPRQTIYAGPKNLVGWDIDDNWHFEDGALVSDGRGSISQNFPDLPDSFAFSFRLKWESKPIFKAFFSSESTVANSGKHDRYFLQFGTAGVEIKRQSSGRTPYHSLITVNRNHESFTDQEAKFEVRIDNRHRRILLYIDGQLEGQAADPIPVVPDGKLIVFQSDSSDSEEHRVSDIEIKEWDAAGDRHRSEDRGDFGEDAIINNKGERFGGRLLGSEGTDKDMIILFKTPLSADTFKIPAPEVSTLFFTKAKADDESSTPLVLGLANAGSLGASACTFGPEEVSLTHPLLGHMNLSREVVKQLQRREWPEDQIDANSEPDIEE